MGRLEMPQPNSLDVQKAQLRDLISPQRERFVQDVKAHRFPWGPQLDFAKQVLAIEYNVDRLLMSPDDEQFRMHIEENFLYKENGFELMFADHPQKKPVSSAVRLLWAPIENSDISAQAVLEVVMSHIVSKRPRYIYADVVERMQKSFSADGNVASPNQAVVEIAPGVDIVTMFHFAKRDRYTFHMYFPTSPSFDKRRKRLYELRKGSGVKQAMRFLEPEEFIKRLNREAEIALSDQSKGGKGELFQTQNKVEVPCTIGSDHFRRTMHLFTHYYRYYKPYKIRIGEKQYIDGFVDRMGRYAFYFIPRNKQKEQAKLIVYIDQKAMRGEVDKLIGRCQSGYGGTDIKELFRFVLDKLIEEDLAAFVSDEVIKDEFVRITQYDESSLHIWWSEDMDGEDEGDG